MVRVLANLSFLKEEKKERERSKKTSFYWWYRFNQLGLF
jgi:hypothetical protein